LIFSVNAIAHLFRVTPSAARRALPSTRARPA
jgi:hypothetical protein